MYCLFITNKQVNKKRKEFPFMYNDPEYHKKYYQMNKEKIKKYITNYNKENGYKSQKEYQKIHHYDKYGITVDEYHIMYNKQSGCCFICGEHHALLCVDHCHSTSTIRGLLCYRCNVMLGLAHDDIDLLYKVISYLNK